MLLLTEPISIFLATVVQLSIMLLLTHVFAAHVGAQIKAELAVPSPAPSSVFCMQSV